MATSTTVAQFADRINKAAVALQNANKVALDKAALAAKRSVEKQLSTDVGSDHRMRNVGKSGAKLSVKYRVAGDAATIQASGPWPLIESDIPAHTIGAKTRLVARQGPSLPGQKLRRGKVTGRAIRLPDGNIRAGVKHPGTKGKHTFRKGIDKSTKDVTAEMAKATLNAVKEALS